MRKIASLLEDFVKISAERSTRRDTNPVSDEEQCKKNPGSMQQADGPRVRARRTLIRTQDGGRGAIRMLARTRKRR